MVVTIRLVSDVLPSLYDIHHKLLHMLQYPSSFRSTRMFLSDPNTSWYFLGESNRVNHGPLAKSTSLFPGHLEHKHGPQTIGYRAHPHEIPLLFLRSFSSLYPQSPCQTS